MVSHLQPFKAIGHSATSRETEIVAEWRANDVSGRRSPHPERAARRLGIAAGAT